MRDITKVIEFLVTAVIPETEVPCIKDMRHIQRHAVYHPPEMQAANWLRLAETLSLHIGESKGVEWKERVGRIMRDEEKVPS